MYNLEQKVFIRRFRWLYSDHATIDLGYEQQMLQLRDMAIEAIEWVPQEYRELFLHFAKGGNIKPGDPIKSGQYLGSLFSCTNSFDRLIILYPTIYDVDFTFCVPDSWLEILDSLSSKINLKLAQHPKFKIEVSDVKEKFNNLKFYYSLTGPAEELHDLDQQIEALIEQTEEHIQANDSLLNIQPSGMSAQETRFLEAGGGVLASPEEVEKMLSDALLKTAAEYALMIEQSLSQKAVAELLGVSASCVRQRLDARSLYGVQADEGSVYPAWQFMQGQSLPNLDKVLAVLDLNLHPLTVQSFFQTPQPDLESDQHHRFLTPREWLFAGYPLEPVVLMARDL